MVGMAIRIGDTYFLPSHGTVLTASDGTYWRTIVVIVKDDLGNNTYVPSLEQVTLT